MQVNLLEDLAPCYTSEKEGLIDAFNRIIEILPFANAGAAPSMGGRRLTDDRLKDLNHKELVALIAHLKAANAKALRPKPFTENGGNHGITRLVLPRFISGHFRAMFAMKEIKNGNEIHRRVSA